MVASLIHNLPPAAHFTPLLLHLRWLSGWKWKIVYFVTSGCVITLLLWKGSKLSYNNLLKECFCNFVIQNELHHVWCVCAYSIIILMIKMGVIWHWQRNTPLPFIFSTRPSCFWSVVELTDVFSPYSRYNNVALSCITVFQLFSSATVDNSLIYDILGG